MVSDTASSEEAKASLLVDKLQSNRCVEDAYCWRISFLKEKHSARTGSCLLDQPASLARSTISSRLSSQAPFLFSKVARVATRDQEQ